MTVYNWNHSALLKKVITFALVSLAVITIFNVLVVADTNYIVSFTPTDPGTPPDSFDDVPDLDPVIIKLGDDDYMKSQSAAYYYHGDDKTEGKFTPTVIDGVSCVKLEYEAPTEAKLPEYRFMFKTPGHPGLTEYHKYVRVTYKTASKSYAQFIMLNNGNRTTIKTLAPDATVSGGEWVRTNAAFIDDNGYLTRLLNRNHITLGFYCGDMESEYYVSEIALFTTPDAAYEYYGDSPRADGVQYTMMNFCDGGTGTLTVGDTYGVHSFNEDTQSLDITYAETTNAGVSYMAKIKFRGTADYSADRRYMRVLYSAKNPEGITNASMYLRTDARANVFLLKENIEDTNGKFVLSDTALISEYAAQRFAGTGEVANPIHNSLIVNTTKPGGTYSIRAVYFFSSRAEAEAFSYDDIERSVTVNGNSIDKYKIVISEHPSTDATMAANSINYRINELTGKSLEIVDDTTPESEYEIIVGKSRRSSSLIENYIDTDASDNTYVLLIEGNDVILTSEYSTSLVGASDNFINVFLLGLSPNPPAEIAITDSKIISSYNTVRRHGYFSLYDNVSEPIRFTETFSYDRGYFSEINYIDEDPTDHFEYKNGVYTVAAEDFELSYIHVYEPDVNFKAKMKYTDAGDKGDFGLMLRFNSREAYVAAGYDFETGEWYIDSREGADFYLHRVASKKADITEGEWYELDFTADGYDASLTVNGELMLTTDNAAHHSPGRIAFYAEDVTASFDDADITLLSGEGTIIRNVEHTLLWDNVGLAGGTVLDMLDGTVRFIYGDNINLISYDGGLTWETADRLTKTYGQPNIIRLNNNDLLLIGKDGNNIVSFTSSDDGKTWTKGGNITVTPYLGDTDMNAVAVNMNDKVFQSPTTDRIFYSQNYETKIVYNGRRVFCEFYYSDDNGASWTKSNTDSWEIEGNENESHFGECKILECSDGTIRMYNSWNMYGCLVYSESSDNGETFGPLVMMPEIQCSLSSMQFARDPYAENDFTYYMVNVNSVREITASMPRSRLTLMKSTDGKNWVELGDVWRWECDYLAVSGSAVINHIVNPFIYIDRDYIFCGSGTSEKMDDARSYFHQMQRQNIYTIKKSTLGVEPETVSVVYPDDYSVLPEGKILAVIRNDDSSVRYSVDSTEFYYSEKHFAHLGIIDAKYADTEILAIATVEETPADTLGSVGDVNGDGKITAGDAALVSSMIHSPDNTAYTHKMRLEADVYTSTNDDLPKVTVLDAARVLLLSVTA